MKPVASLTACELKPTAKQALMLLARQPLRRTRGGWYVTGRKFTLTVGDQLEARGLARTVVDGGRRQLVITGSGKMLAGVLEQRRKQA